MSESPAIDDTELAEAIAVARDRQADVDELEARRRSRSAVRHWSHHAVPPGLAVTHDVPVLCERHAHYWLNSGAGMVRALDPDGLGQGAFHAVDMAALGAESTTLLGFHAPGLFHFVRSLLPQSAVPGPCVGVNVREIASRVAEHHDTLDELSLRETIRVAVSGVVLHEAAHAAEHAAAGTTIDPAAAAVIESLPPDDVFRALRTRLTGDCDQRRRVATHGLNWLRSAGHLAFRATRFAGGSHFVELFVHDVSLVLGAPVDELVDALSVELIGSGDEPLVDILRRDAPPSFARLVAARTAAYTSEELARACQCP